MNKRLFAFSALSLAVAIGLGAFGRHALRESLTESRLATFETAQHYHLMMSLGLMIAALAAARTWTTTLIAFGLAIFSLSLYILALTGLGWLGAITPIGGVLMIVGWCGLGFDFLSQHARDRQESQTANRHKPQEVGEPAQNQE